MLGVTMTGPMEIGCGLRERKGRSMVALRFLASAAGQMLVPH